MQTFMCLVFFDDRSFAGFTEAGHRALTDATIAEDKALRDRGQLLYARPLAAPATAVQVSARHGKLSITDGPFAESKEWLGGFLLLRAADMEEAVQLASRLQIARHARIEVRPTLEQNHSATGETRPDLAEFHALK